jgi:hypothetical protein
LYDLKERQNYLKHFSRAKKDTANNSLILFCAVIPASFAGIAAIRFYFDIRILAFCTDGLVMLHAYGLWFLIHEDWLLFYYLDIPRAGNWSRPLAF